MRSAASSSPGPVRGRLRAGWALLTVPSSSVTFSHFNPYRPFWRPNAVRFFFAKYLTYAGNRVY